MLLEGRISACSNGLKRLGQRHPRVTGYFRLRNLRCCEFAFCRYGSVYCIEVLRRCKLYSGFRSASFRSPVGEGYLERDFLKAGNPRRIAILYSAVLSNDSRQRIENELNEHVLGLFELGVTHFKFAERLRSSEWRQQISRYYYACYNASKALRFFSDGNFSAEVADHKKVGELPDDFPERDRFKLNLETMRTDRNTSDYDHIAGVDDLLSTPTDIALTTRDFLNTVKDYCLARGLPLGGI